MIQSTGTAGPETSILRVTEMPSIDGSTILSFYDLAKVFVIIFANDKPLKRFTLARTRLAIDVGHKTVRFWYAALRDIGRFSKSASRKSKLSVTRPQRHYLLNCDLRPEISFREKLLGLKAKYNLQIG